MNRMSLIVFRGSEPTGEYVFQTPLPESEASTYALTRLKPELSGVILGSHGIIGQSANLPESNPWYRSKEKY